MVDLKDIIQVEVYGRGTVIRNTGRKEDKNVSEKPDSGDGQEPDTSS